MSRNVPKISITVDDEQEPSKTPKRHPLGIGKWLTKMNEPEYKELKPGTDLIDEKELSRHRQPDDIWMALPHEGKMCVFDVTQFSQYHPGGVDILLQNAGTDASEAYRLAHSYVSVDMIGKLRKGFLQRNKYKPSGGTRHLLPTAASGRMSLPSPKKSRWNWTVHREDNTVTLSIAHTNFQRSPMSWLDRLRMMAVWRDGILMVRTLLDHGYHRLVLRLAPSLTPKLNTIRLGSDVGQANHLNVSILLDLSFELDHNEDVIRRQLASSLGSILDDTIVPTWDSTDSDDCFISARVIESRRLNHSKYRLLRVEWPVSVAWMPIPLGHHVLLRIYDNGHCVTRPYTPIGDQLAATVSTAAPSTISGTSVCFLIKIYPQGQMSTLVDRLQIGDDVKISFPIGNIPVNFLTRSPLLPSIPFPYESLFILAAGSGITPMLRPLEIIFANWSSDEHPHVVPSVHAIWFNRTEADEVLIQEFDELAGRFSDRFSLLRVLSEPSETAPTRGLISEAICMQGLFTLRLSGKSPADVVRKTLWLICGPPGFHQALRDITHQWNVPEELIVEFKG